MLLLIKREREKVRRTFGMSSAMEKSKMFGFFVKTEEGKVRRNFGMK